MPTPFDATFAGGIALPAETGRPAWLERYELPSAHALYLHVPFCRSKCAYCDFSSAATRADDPLPVAYAAALARQVDEAADAGLLDGLATGYVGGGTPTLLGASLARLTRAAAAAGSLEELTVEANPESLAEGLPELLAENYVTRVSVGVQSLDDAELRSLGRVHTADEALSALERSLAAGLRTSADLMCAIPHQTPASWAATLAGVLEAGVGHVSVYPLTVEEGTAFSRAMAAGRMEPPDDDAEAAYMEQAEAALLSFGLTRYEVASYSLAGDECLHNLAYWTGVPYLGLGTSAASMLTREGYAALRRVAPQLPELGEACDRVRLVCVTPARELAERPALAEQRFEVEQLTRGEALAEDLMLGARTAEGLDATLVAAARDELGEGRVDACLAGLRADGLLDAHDAPTERGWLLGNVVFGRLWDLA